MASPSPAAQAADSVPAGRYRLETRIGQLDETVALSSYSAVTHVVVALAVAALFWETAPRPYLVGLACALALVCGLSVLCAQAYRRRRRRGRVTERVVGLGHRMADLLALGVGTAWATMPVVLFQPSDADQRMLVVAIAAGLFAGTYVLGPLISVGLYFAVPLVIGSFLGLARDGSAASASLAGLQVA